MNKFDLLSSRFDHVVKNVKIKKEMLVKNMKIICIFFKGWFQMVPLRVIEHLNDQYFFKKSYK